MVIGLRRVVRFLAAGRRAFAALADLRRVAMSPSFLCSAFFKSPKA
jgi:hypothetical protein